MAAPRRIVRWVVIGLSIAAVLTAIPFGFFALRKHVASRMWTRFAMCLAGPPLGAKEMVQSRLRRIHLAVRLTPDAAQASEPWPDRCAQEAWRLAQSWAVKSLVPAIAPIATDVAEQLDLGEVPKHAELLFSTAHAIPWDDAAAATVRAPQQPAPLVLDEPELRLLRYTCPGYAKLVQQGSDAQPADRALFVRNVPEERGRVCTIGPSKEGAFTKVQCAEGDALHGPWRGTGSLYEVITANGEKAEDEANRRFGARTITRVIAGRVLRESGGRVVAARVLDAPPWFGPDETLGSAMDVFSLQSCQMADATAFVARATPSTKQEELDVYFATGQTISKPHRVTRAVLDPKPSAVDRLGPVTLACGADDVRLSWASASAVHDVNQHALFFARCTRDGCKTEEKVVVSGLSTTRIAMGTWGSPPGTFNYVESPFVIDLGASAMLLWDSGDMVSTRVAAKSALPATPDLTLVEVYRSWVDDHEVPGTAAIRFNETSVMVRGDVAIVMLFERQDDRSPNEKHHVFPLRIAADGSARGLPCEDAR